MKYEEAETSKSDLPSEYKKSGMIFKLFIVPLSNDGFKRYCDDFRLRKITDEDAKKYDMDFCLKGIAFFRDINNLYFDNDPKKSIEQTG